jgi:hypothetical protein
MPRSHRFCHSAQVYTRNTNGPIRGTHFILSPQRTAANRPNPGPARQKCIPQSVPEVFPIDRARRVTLSPYERNADNGLGWIPGGRSIHQPAVRKALPTPRTDQSVRTFLPGATAPVCREMWAVRSAGPLHFPSRRGRRKATHAAERGIHIRSCLRHHSVEYGIQAKSCSRQHGLPFGSPYNTTAAAPGRPGPAAAA